MRLARAYWCAWLRVARAMVAHSAETAAPSVADGEHFFETQIRPMLVARCLACHGPEKQEAGLRLDSREALIKGSDAEPVVVPGEPDKSLLVHAVRYEGDVKMPPAGRLEDNELALLTTWVKMGAPWGASQATAPVENMQARTQRAKATHWAYQPIIRPELPATVSDPAWATNAVDRFILAELDRRAAASLARGRSSHAAAPRHV